MVLVRNQPSDIGYSTADTRKGSAVLIVVMSLIIILCQFWHSSSSKPALLYKFVSKTAAMTEQLWVSMPIIRNIVYGTG